jgi:hypothetical protein
MMLFLNLLLLQVVQLLLFLNLLLQVVLLLLLFNEKPIPLAVWL